MNNHDYHSFPEIRLPVSALMIHFAQSLPGFAASDLAHAVAQLPVGGISHRRLGSVNWRLLASLLVGLLPGIYLGSHLASRVPEKILRPTLATMLVPVGGKLIAY